MSNHACEAEGRCHDLHGHVFVIRGLFVQAPQDRVRMQPSLIPLLPKTIHHRACDARAGRCFDHNHLFVHSGLRLWIPIHGVPEDVVDIVRPKPRRKLWVAA